MLVSILYGVNNKTNVLADKSPRNSTSLVRRHNKVDDFKEAPGNSPRSDFVIDIKQSDGPPVRPIWPITFLKGDMQSSLSIALYQFQIKVNTLRKPV